MADVAVPSIAVVTPASGDTVLGVQGGAVKRMPVGGSGLALIGSSNTFTAQQNLSDTAGTAGDCLDIAHFGDGSGSGGTNFTYGIDLHNHNGARQAFVIHQYSAVTEAIRIDNTDNQPAIAIYNTENLTLNPDGIGSGMFFRCDDHGTARFAVRGDGTTLIVQKTGTADNALRVELNAAVLGVEIVANAGAAGVYPFKVNGQNYGPLLTTSTNGGDTLTINKTGTGSGRVVTIANSGTGLSLDIRSGSASLWAVTAAGLPQWVAAANQQTTVGAAGGASALPATPVKYLKVVDSAGTTYVIPAYLP